MKRLLIFFGILLSGNIFTIAQSEKEPALPANIHYLLGKNSNCYELDKLSKDYKSEYTSAFYAPGLYVKIEFRGSDIDNITINVEECEQGYITLKNIMDRWGIFPEYKETQKSIKAEVVYLPTGKDKWLGAKDKEKGFMIYAFFYKDCPLPSGKISKRLSSIEFRGGEELSEDDLPLLYERTIDLNKPLTESKWLYNKDGVRRDLSRLQTLYYVFNIKDLTSSDWFDLEDYFGFKYDPAKKWYFNEEYGYGLTSEGKRVHSIIVDLEKLPGGSFIGVNKYMSLKSLKSLFGYNCPMHSGAGYYNLVTDDPGPNRLEFSFKEKLDNISEIEITAVSDEEFSLKPEKFINDMIVKSGCIEGNCENGDGSFLYSDGYKFNGEFKDGKPYSGNYCCHYKDVVYALVAPEPVNTGYESNTLVSDYDPNDKELCALLEKLLYAAKHYLKAGEIQSCMIKDIYEKYESGSNISISADSYINRIIVELSSAKPLLEEIYLAASEKCPMSKLTLEVWIESIDNMIYFLNNEMEYCARPGHELCNQAELKKYQERLYKVYRLEDVFNECYKKR